MENSISIMCNFTHQNPFFNACKDKYVTLNLKGKLPLGFDSYHEIKIGKMRYGFKTFMPITIQPSLLYNFGIITMCVTYSKAREDDSIKLYGSFTFELPKHNDLKEIVNIKTAWIKHLLYNITHVCTDYSLAREQWIKDKEFLTWTKQYRTVDDSDDDSDYVSESDTDRDAKANTECLNSVRENELRSQAEITKYINHKTNSYNDGSVASNPIPGYFG